MNVSALIWVLLIRASVYGAIIGWKLNGNLTTPSNVAFTGRKRLFGNDAKLQAARNPTNTVFDIKRLIGRKFDDLCVQEDRKCWPDQVVVRSDDDDGGMPLIQVEYHGTIKHFRAKEISAMILAKMKTIAEAYLVGCPVKNAVITVPANFGNMQLQATKAAATIAGFNVLQLICEPTAATIAYGLDHQGDAKHVLVFDFGGGTLDLSVVTMEHDVFEVLATAGDGHVGGQDLDHCLVDYFVADFQRRHNRDLSTNQRAVCRLQSACERAKRTLFLFTVQAHVQIDSLLDGIDFNSTITRACFEALCMPYWTRCLDACQKVLQDAKLQKSDVDEIVLVGGSSSRIPNIQAMLSDFFHGNKPLASINPDEAIAYGATIKATIVLGVDTLAGNLPNMLALEVIPLSLGLETASGVMKTIVDRNSALPCKKVESLDAYLLPKPTGRSI